MACPFLLNNEKRSATKVVQFLEEMKYLELFRAYIEKIRK